MATQIGTNALINLSVGINGAAASATGFGTPLIVDTQNVKGAGALVPIIGTYSSLAAVVAGGFAVYTKAYKLAKGIFATYNQQGRCPTVKIASVAALSAAELTAVEAMDPTWYLFAVTSMVSGDIQGASAWNNDVAIRRHYLMAESQDSANFGDTPSCRSFIDAANPTRTFLGCRKADAQVVKLTISAAFVAANSVTAKLNGSDVASATVFGTGSANAGVYTVNVTHGADAVGSTAVLAIAGDTGTPFTYTSAGAESATVVAAGLAAVVNATSVFYKAFSVGSLVTLIYIGQTSVVLPASSATGTITIAAVSAAIGTSDYMLLKFGQKIAALFSGASASVVMTQNPLITGDGAREIVITALDPLIDLSVTNYACTLGASQNTAAITTTNLGAGTAVAELVALMIPQGLGQSNVAGKTMATAAADNITKAQYDKVLAGGANVYVTIGNRAQWQSGTSSRFLAPGARLFCDTVWSVDRFEQGVNDAVLIVLNPQTGKLPFNNIGIAAVVGAIRGVCDNFVALLMLEPYNFKACFSYPDISAVSPSDKTARVLNNIAANLVSTGAIQSVGITISVQA